jgi:hypothetical protein
MSVLSLTSLFIILASSSADAQMRPNCINDPIKPGACFIEPEDGEPFDFFMGCGYPDEGGVVEGFFYWPAVGEGENDFIRIGPDGIAVLHLSDTDVPAVFCPWDIYGAGLCTPDTPVPQLLYYGFTEFHVNGLILGENDLGCPFVLTAKGEVTRPDDGDTIEVRPVLKFVPDAEAPGGCRLQTCRIFKPGPARK